MSRAQRLVCMNERQRHLSRVTDVSLQVIIYL